MGSGNFGGLWERVSPLESPVFGGFRLSKLAARARKLLWLSAAPELGPAAVPRP